MKANGEARLNDRRARRVARDFLNEWDPIGVSAALRAQGHELDEYDDYLSARPAAARQGIEGIERALTQMLSDLGLSRSPEEVTLRARQLASLLAASPPSSRR